MHGARLPMMTKVKSFQANGGTAPLALSVSLQAEPGKTQKKTQDMKVTPMQPSLTTTSLVSFQFGN